MKVEKCDSSIVLIFLKNPNGPKKYTEIFNIDYDKQKRGILLGTVSSNTPKFSYLNSNYEEITLTAENFKDNDTVAINTRKPLYMVYHSYPGHLSYYLYPGDTAVFTYGDAHEYLLSDDSDIFAHRNDIPFCEITNRKTKEYDLNYTLLKRSYEGKTFFESNEFEYNQQKLKLDSVFGAGLMSKEYYHINSTNNRYHYLAQVARTSTINQFNNIFKAEDLTKDIFISNKEYRSFLSDYLWYILMKGQFIKTSNGVSIDYQAAYDSVKHVFSGKVRDYMLLRCLDHIQKQQPTDVFKKYAIHFMQDVQDTALTNYVADNYRMVAGSISEGESVLTNIDKSESIEFSQLLRKYKDKVIYIDLWASWCAPCRAAMPASGQLREAYAGKDIVFVYFSLDQKFTAWENAAAAENLKDYPHSYLLLNPKEAAILKDWKVQEIPRYLIYDKTGKLVYTNAPSPENEELKQVLDTYLSK